MPENRSGDVIDLAAERRRREILRAKQDLDRFLKDFCEDPDDRKFGPDNFNLLLQDPSPKNEDSL